MIERKYNFLLQLSLWLILKCKDASTHQHYSSLVKVMVKILMLALFPLMHMTSPINFRGEWLDFILLNAKDQVLAHPSMDTINTQLTCAEMCQSY